jgi:hypothetical protein
MCAFPNPFVCCQIISISIFLFCTKCIIDVKEGRLILVVDDLDFRINDVAFAKKIFNKYNTFDGSVNGTMEDLGYSMCIVIC